MIDWCIRHPTAANLLMVAIAALGLVTLPALQRETLPEIKNDKVQVRVAYRGATPEEVEDAVCRRIEDAVEAIADRDETRCEATEGAGTATLLMREGADMGRFLDDISAAVDAIDEFPEGTERAVVEELARTDAVISVAVSGPADPVRLKAYAEVLKDRLMALENVADVQVAGFSDHHLRIELPAWRLRQFGLSVADVAAAIQRRSVGQPAGRLEGRDEDVVLRFDDQRKSVAALEDLVVISGATGASIRLAEIAAVSDRFDDESSNIFVNGARAAILNVTKTQAQDVLLAHADVVRLVEAERERVPPGIQLTLTQDVASVVRDRLDMLVRNGAQGLALVFVVLWLFFSLRYSFWVTAGLPVSFLGALFILPMLGVTLNMISMVGLLIGIGLLMDDAIVIAENVAARLNAGDRPMQAASRGVRQVLPGILSSFVTTLMVFGSLIFITGELGQILRVMPLVLIVVLSVSLVEAFFILPNHLAHSLVHAQGRSPSWFETQFERAFAAVRERGFGPLLDMAVEYRYFTLGLVVMALMGALAVPAAGLLKFVGFPDLDGDVVEARLLLPQGTPQARTEATVARLVAGLRAVNERFSPAQPDGADLVRNVVVIHGENPDAFESGPHVARVVVDLLGGEVRTTRIDEVLGAWRAAVGDLPDVLGLKFSEPAVGPGGRAIDMRLGGSDLPALKAAALDLQRWLTSFDGVLDVSDDLRPGKREVRLRLKPAAGQLGLDARAVADEIRGAFQGVKVDEFPLGDETYEVNVRLVADDRASLADLDSFTVTAADGAQVPLSVVAELEEVFGWGRIHRIDGRRTVTVQGDVDRARANGEEIVGLARDSIFAELRSRYPGVRVGVEGESAEAAKTGQSVVRNVLLGLLGVYLLLALQFRGYAAPLAVMVVIPTALIGVIGGHWLLGLELSMPSIIGAASLFGVVVNDSILLVVFIREASAAGVDVVTAAKQAGRARFRPILLTSITTVAGLAPLLAETSLQAQVLIPLATSLAFGLTSATVIALFLVPALYVILDDLGLASARDLADGDAGVRQAASLPRTSGTAAP